MEHGIVIRTDGKRRKVDVGGNGHRGERRHNEHGRQFTNSNFLRKGDLRETIESNRRGNQHPDVDGEPDLRVYLQQLKGQHKRHLTHDNDLNDLEMDDPMDQFLHRERNSEMDMYMHHGDEFIDVQMGPSDNRRQRRSVEKYDIVEDRADSRERYRNRSFSPDTNYSSMSYRHRKRWADTSGRCGSQSDRLPEEFQMDDFDHIRPDHCRRPPEYPEDHYERQDEYPEDFGRMHPDERFLREEHHGRHGREDGERMHDERNREMMFDEDPRHGKYHSSRYEEDGEHAGLQQQEGGLMYRREEIDEEADWRERSHSQFPVTDNLQMAKQRRYQLNVNDRSASERSRYCHDDDEDEDDDEDDDDDYPRHLDRLEYERDEEPHLHPGVHTMFPREDLEEDDWNGMHDYIQEEEMQDRMPSHMLRRKHPQEFEIMREQDEREMYHRRYGEDIFRYRQSETHEPDHIMSERRRADLDRGHLDEEPMRIRRRPDNDRRNSHDRTVPDRRHLFDPDVRDQLLPEVRDEFNFDPSVNSHGRYRFSPDDERQQHLREGHERATDSYRKGSVERCQSFSINQNAYQGRMDQFDRNSRLHPDVRFEDELRRRDGNPIPSDYIQRREKDRSRDWLSPRHGKRSRSPGGSSDERNPKRRSKESERFRRGDGANGENQNFPKMKGIPDQLKKQEAGLHSKESRERLPGREGDTSEEIKASQKSKFSCRSGSNNKCDRNLKQGGVKEFSSHSSGLNLNSRSNTGRSDEKSSCSQDHSKKTPPRHSTSSEKNEGEKSIQYNSESQSGKSELLHSKQSVKRNVKKNNSGGKGRHQNQSSKPKKSSPQLDKARTPPNEFHEKAMKSPREDKKSIRSEEKPSMKTGQTNPNKFDLDAEISRSLAAYRKSSEVNQPYNKDTVISKPPAKDLSEDIDGVPLSDDEYLNLIQSKKESQKPPAQPSKKTPVTIKLEPLPSRQIGVKSSFLAPRLTTPSLYLGNMDSSSVRNDSFDIRSKYDNDNSSQLSTRPNQNLMDSAKLPSFETEYPYSRSDLQSHCSNQASSNGENKGKDIQANPAGESSYDGVWEKLPFVVGSSSQSFEKRHPQTIPGFGSMTEKAIAPVLQLDDSYFEALKKTLSRLRDIENGANKDDHVNRSGHVSSSSSDPKNNEIHLNEFRDLRLEEKLNAIRFFVRYYTKKNVNDIDLIDLAINKDYQGGVKLEKDYKVRVLGQEKERVIFIGTLHIGGQFFSDAIHQFKRECKRLCYAKAVKVCRECTMEEIRALKPRSPEELKQAMSELIVELMRTEEEDPLNVIKRFIKSLKNAKNVPMNVISKIMNAVQASGVGSRFIYSDEIVPGKSRDHFCKGEVKVAGITIGISAERTKQQAKAAAMEMAYKKLMLLPAEKIVQGLNSKELEEGLAKMNSVVENGTRKSNLILLKESMEKLIDTLKTEAGNTQSSCLERIEKFCSEFKLSPVCVYKKTDRLDPKKLMIMLCELYINDYFVGSGTGTSRNQSKKEAFDNAHTFMLSTNAQQIILRQRKLTQKDLSSPDILPFEKNLLPTVKRESNIKLLKNYNPDEITCALKDIVIVETPALVKNRYQNAFKIIQQSCNHAQMLMEWEFEPVENVFKFHIFIQGQEVSSNGIMAPTKYRAKVLSCAEVLYGFYETQPVIEVIREYDTCGSFSESDIEQQVKMMQMSGMEVDDVPEDVMKEVDEDMDVTNLKWYYAVFNGMFSIYSKEDTLEEITFGPNFKDLFLFKHFKEKYNIRISTVKREGDIYYVATPMLLPAQMYEVLKKSGGESGRYRIVNKLLLPRKMDLQEEIRLAENAASSTDASFVNKFKRETENLNRSVAEPSKYILRTASLGKSPKVALNKPTDTYPEKSSSSNDVRSFDSVGKAPTHSSMKRGEFGASLPVSGQYYPSYAPNASNGSR